MSLTTNPALDCSALCVGERHIIAFASPMHHEASRDSKETSSHGPWRGIVKYCSCHDPQFGSLA